LLICGLYGHNGRCDTPWTHEPLNGVQEAGGLPKGTSCASRSSRPDKQKLGLKDGSQSHPMGARDLLFLAIPNKIIRCDLQIGKIERVQKMKKSINHGSIVSVCLKSEPGLPKYESEKIQIKENFGVIWDYHASEFIRHRWIAKLEPTKPNNRQILLVDQLIYAELEGHDINLEPGMLGENLLIDGISVMQLPVGAKLQIGTVILEITEIRRPCYQLNEIHPDLQDAVMPDKEDEHSWNAGMLAIVLKSGTVRSGDQVSNVD
jgi:hypothetical protein